MEFGLEVKPLGTLARLADAFMYPFMKLLIFLQSGSYKESPQRTHFWNNQKYSKSVIESKLDTFLMAYCKGIFEEIPAQSLFRHLYWSHYVVLQPAVKVDSWYVGWIMPGSDEAGVSRILIKRKVRMLMGPGDTQFFGIDAATGKQISLRRPVRGRLGQKGSLYQNIPLH